MTRARGREETGPEHGDRSPLAPPADHGGDSLTGRSGVRPRRVPDSSRLPASYAAARPVAEAEVPDPVDELMQALGPFVVGNVPGISQALYRAMYRLQTSHRHGPQGQELAVERLVVMDPDRLRIPDTDDGKRLRAALRAIRDRHTQP
ncbi:hypothetical protein [Streptomyces hokutonensis]|uniref:hypothetical protein n=1 Tax=Streptomyces hokutonensis TaxID=1306990 RepID=UPI003696C3D9